MDSDRIAQARARIDEAVGRIEAAARQPAGPGGDHGLARKYETLRREADAAVTEIDRVIGSLEA